MVLVYIYVKVKICFSLQYSFEHYPLIASDLEKADKSIYHHGSF